MGRLTAIVLGAAAGGGFPQWNCRCPRLPAGLGGRCARQAADPSEPRRISADGEQWTLLNASPDLRAQIQATPALHPRAGVARQPDRSGRPDRRRGRSDGGPAHAARTPKLSHFSPPRDTLAALGGNPIFGVLAAGVVARTAVAPDKTFALPAVCKRRYFRFRARRRSISKATIPRLMPRPAPMSAIEIRPAGRRLGLRAGCGRR